MGKEIKIKITPEGKVEIDSTVFDDCKSVADHLAKILGRVEKFSVKEDDELDELIKIDNKE
ncbi:hypothetical protein MNBD_DELTA01-814 [hydrothermal vent metagenome]|uniref:Uncharacterized protein n=1 Tax=hydrothermal vent metagenome TaxID=652676 RepID=A0A3B0RHJ6_9ZZZZ